jgi:inner membrane protein
MQKSLLLKFVIIFVVALLLLIPLLMIQGKVSERSGYLEQVKYSISSSWTGEQQISAPLVVIPYQYEVKREVYNEHTKVLKYDKVREQAYKYIPLDHADFNIQIDTERRFKGIYSVPVYGAKISLKASINSAAIAKALEAIQGSSGYLRHEQPILSVLVKDPRGIRAQPELSFNGESQTLKSGSANLLFGAGLNAELPEQYWRGLDRELEISLNMQLSGMEKLYVQPTSRTLELAMGANWPHPEFIGSFLPYEREISSQGFNARWSLNEYATGIVEGLKSCERQSCYFGQHDFGINLFESVDIYQQTERAIKYAMLFILVSYAAFFVFETLKGTRIHPVQYALVGLSLAVFYLLLIAFSEHMKFGLAYLISAFACVSLISAYIYYVFQVLKESLWFSVSLAALYGMLYVILQQEDHALLTGSLLTFGLLATLMMSTRKIDWYQLGVERTDK